MPLERSLSLAQRRNTAGFSRRVILQPRAQAAFIGRILPPLRQSCAGV